MSRGAPMTSQPRGPIKIKLKRPITMGEQTYSELTMRQPVLADFLASEEVSDVGAIQGRALAAIMCGVPLCVITSLGPRDLDRVSRAGVVLVRAAGF